MALISDPQKEAIREIVQMGIERSVAVLADISGEEIRHTIRGFELLENGTANVPSLGEGNSESFISVKKSISGDFYGHSVLVIPEIGGRDLVGLILKDSNTANPEADAEEENFAELGNIVLNSFLGSVGDAFGMAIPTTLPLYVKGNDIAEQIDSPYKDPIGKGFMAISQVDLAFRNQTVNEYVVFLVDPFTVENFLEMVDAYISKSS